ncbi:MAG: hypothetical protein ACTTKF_01065 [Bacteroides sp.]
MAFIFSQRISFFSEKIPLTISNIYFYTKGSLYGDDEFGGKLTLKNVTGYIYGGIYDLTEFTTEGCGIIKPKDGYFDKKKRAVVDADGNVAKSVQIGSLTFPLYIAGEQVTRKNCKNLSVIDGVTVAEGGEFKYDPEANTLTMKDVTVSVGDDDNAIENRGIEGLKIKVSGTNRLESTNYSGFGCVASTHISGDGTLTTASTGNSGVIVNSTTVTISDITLEASGKYGICGAYGTETLILENAKVIAKGTEAGIVDLASFSTQECAIVAPEFGQFDATQHAVVDGYYNKAKEVVIAKPYGLYIAGVPVTELNRRDLSVIDGVTVASGGYFKYDAYRKTLEMKDVTVSVGKNKNAIDNRGVDGLEIVVLGENHLKTTGWSAFICSVPTSIKGDGSLTATVDNDYGEPAVYVLGTTLTISDITLKASGGRGGISGNDGRHGEKLFINRAKVSASARPAGIAKLESLILDNCSILFPVGGEFDPTQFAVVDSDKKVAEFVNIERVYALYVAGEQVTSANCDALANIVGVDQAVGGHCYYKPGNKRLYMKGVTVSPKGNHSAIDNKGIEELEIDVSGTNRLKATGSSTLHCHLPTNIRGGGLLM